jgi:sugar O-acyltransferase (sialic acid O-acetyltransferase NeuD family)
VHVVGAGGHAKVVIATLRCAGFEVEAAWDDMEARHGTAVLGVPVLGTVDAVPRSARVVIAVGSNPARRDLAARLQGREFVSVVHPAAVVHTSVEIAPGAVVFAGAILQPDVALGPHVIVNTGASVDHDGILERFVHVAPGARLAGSVVVREGAFVAVGASVIPEIEIGAWATVGAGGVVIRSIPAGVTAVGCPARVLVKPSERS